jgi:hypothetical protein
VIIPPTLSETQNLYVIDALKASHQPARLRKGYAVLVLIGEVLLPEVSSVVYKSESFLTKRRTGSIEEFIGQELPFIILDILSVPTL